MNTTIILIVLALVFILMFQLMRINSLLNKKKTSTDIPTLSDNDNQGKLFLIFGWGLMLLSFISIFVWKDVMLKEPASVHGKNVDSLLNITWIFLLAVFFVLEPILFYIVFKYRGFDGHKAEYDTLEMEIDKEREREVPYQLHDNKLELIWTSVPALVFAVLIFYGLFTWNQIFYYGEEEQEPIVVELYAQQFNWTARYAGLYDTPNGKKLGAANVHFVKGANVVGVDPNDPAGQDDIITKELHLPVNRRVVFKFRSQDVLHSAYMPHFRAQMNCVPGMITEFSYIPTMTTDEYKELASTKNKVYKINEIRSKRNLNLPQDEQLDAWDFDYILLCNKICGGSHYNMQMKIVVESEQEFKKWLQEQAQTGTVKQLLADNK